MTTPHLPPFPSHLAKSSIPSNTCTWCPHHARKMEHAHCSIDTTLEGWNKALILFWHMKLRKKKKKKQSKKTPRKVIIIFKHHRSTMSVDRASLLQWRWTSKCLSLPSPANLEVTKWGTYFARVNTVRMTFSY